MILGTGYSALDFSLRRSVNDAFSRKDQTSGRLATLKRIQTASDDPSGLIAASNLANELASVRRVSSTNESTRALLQTADSVLASAASMLSDMQSRVVSAANDTLTMDQREALQFEMDAALDAINRLGNTTFAGQKVFTGETRSFLTGPDPAHLETLTLPAIDDGLGGSSGVLADLRSGGGASMTTGDLESASDILAEAQSQLLGARAMAGAFEKYVVDSTERLMADAEVNTAARLSAIQDADVAAEASRLVRDRILAQSTIAVQKLAQGSQRTASNLLLDIL